MIASTVYEIVSLKQKKIPNQFLSIFSVYTNSLKIFKMIDNKSPDNIECFNGLRTMSILWVIFRNGNNVKMFMPHLTDTSLTDVLEGPFTIFIQTGVFGVDTFLVISGVLISWSVMKELDRNKSVNLLKLYFHRYIRLTPVLAAALLFVIAFIPLMGNGPLFSGYAKLFFVDSCKDSWWTLLLYIQNYYNPSDGCFGHAWFLNVNMQLFIIAPLFIWPLWKYGKNCLWILLILVLASIGCIISTWVIRDYRLSPFR